MARPWYRSTWVRIGGGVLLLGLIVALAVPFLIRVDRFRPQIVRAIEASTGRQVQIDALRLYLMPTVHIRAYNVRIKNPQGFPQGNAIVVKSLDLGVAPRALLSRRLDVTYIAASGVRVNLLRTLAGQTNFDLPVPPRGVRPGKPAAATGGAPLVALGHVGGVTVKGLEITFADAAGRKSTPSFSLTGVNVRIGSIDPNAPDWSRKLDIVADLRGARLTTPSLAKPILFRTGQLAFKDGAGRGTFSLSLENMRLEGTAAFASLDPLSITFAVTIPELDVNKLGTFVLGGAIGNAPTPQVVSAARGLLARGEVQIGRLVVPPFEATHIKAQVGVYTDTIRLDAYAFSAYGGNVEGAAALDRSTAGLPLTVTAKVRGTNLERAVSAIAPRAPKIIGTMDADLRVATTLGRDPKGSLTARGDVRVDRLIFSPLEATRMSSQLSVHANTIRLDAYALSAYGGTIQGIAALNYSGASLPTAVTAKVRGVNLERAVTAIAPRARKITGTLDADLRLTTALARNPQTTLAGAGTFAVRNGSFPGMDLKSNLALMARAMQLNVPAGDTRFSYFGGDLRIAQERGYSNALKLDGEGLEGTGRGSFGFNKTLDYTGIGVMNTLATGTSPSAGLLPSVGQILGNALPGGAGTTRVKVPFYLRGTMDDPKFSLAGTPGLIRDQSPQQPPQRQPQQPQPALPPDLFKLPPGLPAPSP
jgi:uncharacterized protein involved in outer membrane biogenesis